MKEEAILAQLRAITAFSRMEDADLAALRKSCTERFASAGEVLFRAGDPAHELFLLIEGEVRVFVTQSTLDLERELRILGPGSYFGEVSLLSGSTRTASVRAVRDTRLLALSRDVFIGLLGRLPSLALSICAGMARYIDSNRSTGTSISHVRLRDFPDYTRHTALLPASVSRATRAVVVSRSEDTVTVGMVDPYDSAGRAFLQQALMPLHAEFVAISPEDFASAEALIQESTGTSAQAAPAPVSYVDANGVAAGLHGNAAGDLLESILQRAIQFGASDVHLEPRRDHWQARLRLDGRMIHLETNVPLAVARPMLGRLKVMAGLDITEQRVPQDGGFELLSADRPLDARLSLIPTENGEKAVIRLFDAAAHPDDLAALIPARPVEHFVRDLFLQPAGLVLVTGPTGSGKTTTLYAGLRGICQANNALNIVTVEDPIDRRLDYATQVQINPATGMDFCRALRGLLRQDPDIILVGEIRDRESAAITLEAANTGHMVFSSLHTHTALDAITRLKDLGMEPYLIAGCLRGIITQQLLPRVCTACAAPVENPRADSDVARLIATGVLEEGQSISMLRRGVGCAACRYTGEKGRIALIEVLSVERMIRDLVEEGASAAKLEASLGRDNFVSRRRYGRFLLLEGWVSPAAMNQALTGVARMQSRDF